MRLPESIKVRFIFLIFFLTLSFDQKLEAQIINVESLRKTTDTTGWAGSVGLDVDIIKNNRDIFRIANRTHIQYKKYNHLVLFVTNLNFQKVNDDSFINRGTQHIRYNYGISPSVKLEAFVQGQYDEISELAFRGLVGLGPRFKLSKNDNYRFYLGTIVMYEYEKASDKVNNEINRDIRGSAYFSFSLYPTETISMVSTTYYQPKLFKFGDYRISSETSLGFKVYKNLSFVSRFTLFFDADPIGNAPATQYQLTNGLSYSFN